MRAIIIEIRYITKNLASTENNKASGDIKAWQSLKSRAIYFRMDYLFTLDLFYFSGRIS